ncbi:recombinase family protein [Ruegeria atlantica]|uniref:recombinase family protein n=1 Tax=Ruegeria atlantica TaxID=81569 RepID=UPI0020C3813C|nr:recombinase family protein [Ruegeria atlantica]
MFMISKPAAARKSEEKRKLIGYARVSTDDQNLDLQIQSLRKSGCLKIFQDRGVSGSQMERPGLEKAILAARGGTLVVWRLDRMGRSLQGLVKLMGTLVEQDTEFQSLTEAIDTRSSAGVLFFHIMAALSEFERSLISERTKAGLDAARLRGASLGRPRVLSDHQISNAIRELSCGNAEISDLCDKLGVSKRTLQRYMQEHSSA